MLSKDLSGAVAIILTCVGYAPYLISIVRGRTKPHLFTWLIWGLATGIVFTAQYKSGGGAGAWATGFTCLLSLLIIAFAFRQSEKDITRNDWIAFLSALAAIPVWYATHDPLAAVILVTLIDGVAYLPTFRKSVIKPYEEEVWFYVLSNVKHALALYALESYSATTVLYPATLICMNFALLTLLFWRQTIIKKRT